MDKLFKLLLVIFLVFSAMFTTGCGNDNSYSGSFPVEDSTQLVKILINSGSVINQRAVTKAEPYIIVNGRQCLLNNSDSSLSGYHCYNVFMTKSELSDASSNGLEIIWGNVTKKLNCKSVFNQILASFDSNPENFADISFDTGMNEITRARTSSHSEITVPESEKLVEEKDGATQLVKFLIDKGDTGISQSADAYITVNDKRFDRNDTDGSMSGYWCYDVYMTAYDLNAAQNNGLKIQWGALKKKLICPTVFSNINDSFNSEPSKFADIRFNADMSLITGAAVAGADSDMNIPSDETVVENAKDEEIKLSLTGDTLFMTAVNNIASIESCTAVIQGINNNFKKTLDFSDVQKYFTINSYRGGKTVNATLKEEFKNKLSNGQYECTLKNCTYISVDGEKLEAEGNESVIYSKK